MEFKYKRAPAIPKLIEKIDPVKDIRVRLLGKVMEKTANSITLEDSSGKTEIIIETNISESLRIGETIRVFCRVFENELKAELIQDMNNLDTETYEKTFLSA
ncbi:MAG: hypothetical protein V1870_05450 [Candidatus Aenigmatarchaeota archaeon]